MLLSMYYLQDGKTRIKNLADGCRGNIDLSQHKPKMYAVLSDMVTACEEISFTLNDYSFSRIKEAIIDVTRIVKNSEDLEQIRSTVHTFADAYLSDIDFREKSTYDFSRPCGRHVTRHLDLNAYSMNQLGGLIAPQSRNIQVLDTRCGGGNNLTNITYSISNKTTYGIETDQTLAKIARANLNRIAVGSLAGSRISNDVFDVMITEPLIAWEASFIGNQSPYILKAEKKFLNDTLKYLRVDGLSIMVLPYYRLYRDICLFVARNFRDVQIVRLGSDFNEYGAIAIIGIKKANKEIDPEISSRLSKCHNQDQIPGFSQEMAQYVLPRDILQVETFRGSVLDSEELLGIVRNSGCMDSFWKNQKVEKLSESSKQPLLPFNIGQIGLVLTSGCLDGIIDEGDGHFHLIKGKVSKQTSLERNYNSDTELETQETISNRVEINVLLPNGEYKILA